MRQLFKLVAVSVFISGSVLLAQTAAGVGAISGIVIDPTGATVSGAQVTVENSQLGIHRNLTTTSGGVFNAPSLVPNSGYQVTVNAAGFAPFENRDITVHVGENVSINVALQLQSSSTRVEVSEEAPIVDVVKTDVSQNVDQTQIDNLPINGRRVDQFVLLTPGVVPDNTFGDLSFRGIGTGNTFLLDGNDTTEQFYQENGGRTRIATNISQDAVQEFQVLTAAYSAEYGRTAGGVVNTVTRSGTNSFHGTGFWFFRNRTLDARDPLASFNPKEVRHQFGGTVSGPIIKDKLFFLFNTEEQLRDFPIVSTLVSNVVSGTGSNAKWVGCGVAGGGLPAASAAQCNAINSLLPGFFTTLPRTANQQTGFGKIDWRPSDKSSFSFDLNYQHFYAPNGISSAIVTTNGSAFSGNGNDDVQVRHGRAQWTFVPSSSIVNEARFGWFKDRQADTVNSALVNPNIGTISLSVGGLAIGFANYLPRIQPSENRFEFADNLSLTAGKHSFKFGVDYLNTEDYYNLLFSGNGSYSYSNVNAFALDYGTGGKHYNSYTQAFGNPIVDTTIKEVDAYAQDQYRVNPNLTLYYGLRYEKTFLPQPSAQYAVSGFPAATRIPQDNLDFAPRVGFAWNLNGGNTVIRSGYGIYYGRYPGALVETLFTANPNYVQTISINNGSLTSPSAAGPSFPNILPNPTVAAGSGTLEFAASNLRTPYTQQADFAIEQKLGRNTSLTLSYVWTRGAEFFTVRDLNYPATGATATYRILDSTGTQVGTFATPVYLAASKVYSAYTHVYEVDNGGNTYYNGMTAQVQHRFANSLEAALVYTWSHAQDNGLAGISSNEFYSNPTSTLYNGAYQQQKGDSNLDQRQRLVVNWVWSPTIKNSSAWARYLVNGWQLSGISTIATGLPATETVSVQTSYPGLANSTYLTGFNGTSQVPFLSQNTLRLDPTTRVDARLSKMFDLTERVKMTLAFEAFNLTNTVTDTSINTVGYYANWIGSAATGSGTLAPYQSTSSGTTPVILGRPTAYAGFPDGTNARRAQASVRFQF